MEQFPRQFWCSVPLGFGRVLLSVSGWFPFVFAAGFRRVSIVFGVRLVFIVAGACSVFPAVFLVRFGVLVCRFLWLLSIYLCGRDAGPVLVFL